MGRALFIPGPDPWRAPVWLLEISPCPDATRSLTARLVFP